MSAVYLFSLFTFGKLATICIVLLLVPAISQCGKKKKGAPADLKKKKKAPKTDDDDSEKSEKPVQKKKKRVADKTGGTTTMMDMKSADKKKKALKKKQTLDEDEDGDGKTNMVEKKSVPQSPRLRNNSPDKNRDYFAMPPGQNGAPGKSPNKLQAYKPPPVHDRPRHPGFEMPIDPTEESKTFRQVERFPDAQNFCNY